MEATESRMRVSERGDFLSGRPRSFVGESANDRSRTEASGMVDERSTLEVVRECETARNRTERLYERNQMVLLSTY